MSAFSIPDWDPAAAGTDLPLPAETYTDRSLTELELEALSQIQTQRKYVAEKFQANKKKGAKAPAATATEEEAKPAEKPLELATESVAHDTLPTPDAEGKEKEGEPAEKKSGTAAAADDEEEDEETDEETESSEGSGVVVDGKKTSGPEEASKPAETKDEGTATDDAETKADEPKEGSVAAADSDSDSKLEAAEAEEEEEVPKAQHEGWICNGCRVCGFHIIQISQSCCAVLISLLLGIGSNDWHTLSMHGRHLSAL